MTKTFLVQPDGSVSASKEEQETRMPASSWPEIEEVMKDRNASPEKVLRRILGRMVTCLREMEKCESDPSQAEKFKQYAREALVLLRLERSYMKGALLDEARRLNLDGPKLQLLFDKVFELIEQAIRDAVGKNSPMLAQNIIDNFYDRIGKNEPQLRRRVQEIGSTTGTKAVDATESGKSGSVVHEE